MSVELGFVDANVLVYAMDADAPQHAASRALLDAARDLSTTLYVTSQILCEFYSIVTNARRVPNPRSPGDAPRAISGLLAFLQVLPIPGPRSGRVDGLASPPPRHCRPVTGGNVFDLQIAAAMQADGIQRIYTFNADDFEVFPEIAVQIP
jgi:predicted nucleic acid-binding protein